jgi:type I restriction enzyme, S subunit
MNLGLEWHRRPLSELVEFRNGKSVKPGGQGQYPVFGSNGIIGASNEFMYKNAIILGRVGAYCGSVKYSKGPFWASDNTIVVEPLARQLNVLFCYYLLRDANLNRHAGGAAQPLLTQSRLRPLEFPIPTLDQQDRIASILLAYDDLIANNTRRIAILEEMARRIFEEWFVHFRAPGCEDLPMVDSAIGPVPRGWELRRLEEVAFIVMGQSPKSQFYNENGEGLPFHQGVTDFGDFFPSDRVYCTELARVGVPGDILISVRAPVGRVNIALKKLVIGRGVAAVRSKQATQSLLLSQLRRFFHEEDQMGHGTIFKAIGKDDLQNILLLSPPTNIANAFQKIAEPLWSLIKTLTLENRNLRAQRDLLLPKLISGEIDVSRSADALPEAAE